MYQVQSSTRKASTTSPDPMSFKLPSTESEVAELLASSKTPQERREIFQALLGTQSNPIPPLPSIPKSSSGVHLIPIGRKKLTTDHTGIQVHHSPFEALKETYSNTLKTLQNFPTASVYRQSVESLTQRNLEIVLKHEVGKAAHTSQEIEDSIKALEIELGVNLVEEAIDQAKDEHSLVLSLYDSEAWSDLIEKPSPGQWDSFTVPSSTSYPKD
ncbi:uncharacterized protein MELLADRAFT_13951 [Melampsora larici-populina 98AG31]|uniref:Uncharacterized protein n=1 Tax=Melampsora larici-populina (strain 98AG31 / pathotype 3-4-7) TaxID=747676 RepID=F4RXV8_MELLP|nr:uncharacterized protein MELLADRAFT_13951 [Melampsora larici-populina 98AG31]EGG02796.1 hypothetical protein MELLADRAFT_13951 [Melampsora larici-populina 98AG31]